MDVFVTRPSEMAAQFKVLGGGMRKLAQRLQALGPSQVLITDAGQGAYWYNGKSFVHRTALRVKPVSTTGAGDAFGAGWLAGFLKSDSAKGALDWGMYNSNSVIMQVGAQRGILSERTIGTFAKQYGRARHSR
jgi:sugar/nucleoside kinase (ribokinase family)